MDGPEALAERGADTWRAITAARDADPLWSALALEACRMIDRLDQLNEIIAGKGVLRLMHLRRVDERFTDDAKVIMTVDAVLVEAREQAGQLRQIVAQLKLGQSSPKVTGRSALDDLAAKRADRRTGAAS